MYTIQKAFWSETSGQALEALGTTQQGLSSEEAERRLKKYGLNRLRPKKRSDPLTLLLGQFKSPIILLLLFAAFLSFYLGDKAESSIILVIVFLSGALGFWQEYSATNAVEKLLEMVQVKAQVLRDGREADVPFEVIVPGDVLVLNAGDGIPGDCLILESRDLFVDEAALTGETYPVEKVVKVLPPETPLSKRVNSLFMGTHVVSGTAKAIVIRTGLATEFGHISEELRFKPPTPEFERGVKHFGYLLLEITTIMIIAIFAINVYFHRPVLDSFLFALALAVGLTPQLLPAIISINLATGARRMAKEKVIVKQLSSIENFGSMNVLCCDKTGTITEGKVEVYSAIAIDGQKSDKVLLYAGLNACMESGFASPIDDAIRRYCKLDLKGYKKVDEVPYDFIRKRLSILATKDGANIIMTKGALQNTMDICSKAEINGKIVGVDEARGLIMKQYDELSARGFRTLGVAYKDIGQQARITKDDERDMTFLGIVVLYDPPKPGILDAIKDLRKMGITLKVITGDNALVASYINRQICEADGMAGSICNTRVITGSGLNHMSDDALMRAVNEVNVFAEVEPNQKERIIMALKRSGNVVGYMGDGINDGPALHAADVGISVDSAVDVAKEAAQIVLMEKELGVLAKGVEEGRKTFANTLKYVFMATSANFGNMFSMAGASLLLSFLPLLPTQILLTNLMTDFPEMTIATDTVDVELVDRPRRWNIDFIKKFMLTFGLVSSIFDFMTFGVLLFLLHASERQFQTGWFMESVVSATMIVLVIRTRKPFFKSRPGKLLVLATLLVVGAVIALPYTPIAPIFKFEPLPPVFILTLAIIVGLYVAMAEIVKRMFYRTVKF
ncbi:magnesium-transporting P-type ATPase [Methanocella paludicola SANAE]|uniref:Magnesium-transporting ATPase, P-type 1 n=1 Tax=Methanocella paludicola (strain DSM 17711 / JCM 13418 / NBRC 101707 / SANAE) TaxID=304371 RepID=D1Z029_METPS|nr:magnesium-translocating P-type ATPase [Methanocella paludicola]BAI62051.1 magnesium-transporting P-type ATPase [Methanocella paludicola SANAE]